MSKYEKEKVYVQLYALLGPKCRGLAEVSQENMDKKRAVIVKANGSDMVTLACRLMVVIAFIISVKTG